MTKLSDREVNDIIYGIIPVDPADIESYRKVWRACENRKVEGAMSLIDAVKQSQKTGKHFRRPNWEEQTSFYVVGVSITDGKGGIFNPSVEEVLADDYITFDPYKKGVKK